MGAGSVSPHASRFTLHVSPPEWSAAPGPLTLADDEVHVWRVPLDQSAAGIETLSALLSERERDRAERLRSPLHRDRAICGHGALRTVLAAYLLLEPAEIAFRYGPWGKPALDPERTGEDLRFNVSHSEDLALIAVARGRDVGIDVECVRTERPAERLAQRFFSPAENAAYAALPAERRQHAFYACWTRKEAYIKAIGRGLTLPLDAFDVSVDPDQHPTLLGARHPGGDPGRWEFLPVPRCPGYAAALLVERGPARPAYWNWR